MTYYTSLVIIVWLALAILCILVRANNRIKNNEKATMYFIYAIVAVSTLAEWLGVRFSGNPDIPTILLRIVKLFDYVLTPIAGGIIILQLRMGGIWKKALISLISFNTIYQIISFFTGWMITIDANNVYAHGKGYFIYIILYFLIAILDVGAFAVYGRKFRKQNRISLYSILLFVMVGIGMQEIFGGEIRTAYISLVLGMTFLFIHYSEFSQLALDDKIHEQMVQISIDPLTGISSRYAYKEEMNKLAKMDDLPHDLVAFSIDINGLKMTNDTLGHIAGDELICGASDCIVSCLGKYGKCFRTGGDEFIVFANVDKEDIESLKDELNNMASKWHGKEVHSLSLSIGCAAAIDHVGITPEKLVTEADKQMYEQKAKFYQSNGNDRRKSDR